MLGLSLGLGARSQVGFVPPVPISELLEPATEEVGSTSFDGATFPAGFGVGNVTATREACYLESVSVRLSASGTGELVIVNADTSIVDDVIAVTAASSGVNTFALPDDYQVGANRWIFYRRVTGGEPRFTSFAGANLAFANASYSGEGNSVTVSSNVNAMAISYTTRRLSETNGPQTPVFTQTFAGTSAPADWTGTTTAPYSVNDGLEATGTGAWTGVARWNNNTGAHRKTISARVVAVDAASIFAVTTVNQGFAGSGAVHVDGTANTLSIYYRGPNGTPITLAKSVAIPALVAGRAYVLQATQRDNHLIGKLYDTVADTAVFITLQYREVNVNTHTIQGQPGFVHLAGTTKVESFSLTNDLAENLRAVILGDSNLEATVLNSNAPVGPSWGQRLAAEYPIMVSGIAQSTTATALARLTADFAPHNVDMVIIATGTNDSTQAVYRTQVAAIQAAVGASEVVLVTQPPKSSGQAVRTACNDDVRAEFFGALRFVDVAIAVSLANDGVTIDTTYIFDGVHYNRAGQLLVKSTFETELPDLVA